MNMSCKKASELIDKRLVSELSFKEKISLRLHIAMCDLCSVYSKQSQSIDEAIKGRLKEVKPSSAEDVSLLIDKIKSNFKSDK